MATTAFGINCTLTRSPAPSSTETMLGLVLDALSKRGVACTQTRLVDHDVPPGVRKKESPTDAWPRIRRAITDADILVVATPIWMGQASSLLQRVFERMDATFDEADDDGRLWTFGKVAIACVVGNEDGAHHVCAQAYQALTDLGFTVPGGGGAYWVGEAMGDKDFKDLKRMPRALSRNIGLLATNAAHLAALLKADPYPSPRKR